MAQKPFISDMGIRLGDWLLTQNSDGDLTAGHVAVDANNAQRAFRADHGVKIGNWEMYADGDELSVTENRAMAGSQRPFIADAGFQISDWTFTQDTDGNMLLSTTAIVSSGTETSGDTGSGGSAEPAASADWSAYSFAYTLDNPNAYGTSTNDRFSYSVAVDGDYAIVGAYQEDDAGGGNSGKAYIFDATTGSLVHTLDNPNDFSSGSEDQFGSSVAISGNYAIVSALYEDDVSGSTSGKAYIFDVTTGALVHTLDNPNAYGTSGNDYFGRSVSISGNYAIVGAYAEDDAGGSNSGKAYIFDVATGALVHTLDNPNAYGTSASDFFASSVAISGDYAIIGAVGEGIQDDYEGKAYIYDVSTGALVHTLDSPGPIGTGVNDNFGWAVAISGDRAIVGAYGEGDNHSDPYLYSGKAYIYNVSTGALLHTLDNPNAFGSSDYDQFGSAVAISGDYAIVGALGEDDAAGTNSSKAYIFDATTGTLVHTLDNPNPFGISTNDQFGSAVAISGARAIVGAQGEDDAGGTSSGKAYIFTAG